MQKNEPKIVVWDLEILRDPDAVDHHWFSVSNYPGTTLKADMNSIICFGYKYLGDKEAQCINAWDFAGWHESGRKDDSGVCLLAYEILKDADAIITHNGRRFDWKFLNTRLAFHGLPTLPNIPHIDTCQLSRSNLYLLSNSLNNVAKFLNCPLKLQHTGQKLWTDVRHGKKEALNLMERYCKQDVQTLEAVFYKLRKYAKKIPNHNLFKKGKKAVCPNCGSRNLIKWGKRYSKTQSYQRYQCQSCFSISQEGAKGVVKKT